MKQELDSLFTQEYNKLNKGQLEAVNAIYGPVLVVAGPGTGKTQVLALRIANLLRSEAQINESNILCLTYTDEAANSMRNRLVNFIGSAAHKITISTFHGFCNSIIQQHQEYFSWRNLQPVGDLERAELLHELINELPKGHVLRRLSGDIYYDTKKLASLFDFMKREHISAEDMSNAIDQYCNDLPNQEAYIYKVNGKNFKKGDLKQKAIDEEIAKMEQTRAAANLLPIFNDKMKQQGWYDFTDMILWVIEAFEKNPDLLAEIQERFQFILVDEFQDTNGAQNEIIQQLCDNGMEDPNIFVVGDDDQSIYEFQGARIRNIIDFYEHHKNHINVITLTENYRSIQNILDLSTQLIEQNKQRLTKQLSDIKLSKQLIAANEKYQALHHQKPVIKAFQNVLQEEASVVLAIESLMKQGEDLSNVAILYAQHKQADNIIALLERKGIPFHVRKDVDILSLPLIQQIIQIITYLVDELKQPFSQELVLFELLHAPYWGIKPTDIATVSLYLNQNKHKDKSLGFWRLVLVNKTLIESMNIESKEQMIRAGEAFNDWLQHLVELPLPLFLEQIIYKSGIIEYAIHAKDYSWQVQVIHTLFSFVKEIYSRNPKLKAADFLDIIERMNEEQITLPIQRIVQQPNGVKLYTAHSSKGNEFKHVFLIGCNKNFWESKTSNNNSFKLPDNIINRSSDVDVSEQVEVARRLFFVSMTRAKEHLQVSYSLQDNNGKELGNSVFIDEISSPNEREVIQLSEDEVIQHLAWAMTPSSSFTIELANKQYIERQLAQFTLSASSLNTFLKCQLAFYYQYILKVPFQASESMSFGTAIHYALEKWFERMLAENKVFPPLEDLVRFFEQKLYVEKDIFSTVHYERRLEQGKTLLHDYYNHYIQSLSTNVLVEQSIERFMLDGVPVTGKIDKIEFLEDQNSVVVYDYKTGNFENKARVNVAPPNEKHPLGGDYWRQMVFYKLLLEQRPNQPLNVSYGVFDYVEKGKKTQEYKRFQVPIFANDVDVVLAQIKDTWSKIMNLQFNQGCGEKDCRWCNFFTDYELFVRGESESTYSLV